MGLNGNENGPWVRAQMGNASGLGAPAQSQGYTGVWQVRINVGYT